MPHSNSSEASQSSELEDSVLPDAPPVEDAEEAADSDGSSGAPRRSNEAAANASKIKLEELFDDDDDEDDEFQASGDGSSGPVSQSNEPAKATSKTDVKLEDLFDDDEDDDEEFPSNTSGNRKMESSPPAAPLQFTPSSIHSDPEIMSQFYQRLFPFRFLFQWLNHAVKPTNDFCHREFAFTLQNDAYLRYQSFQTGDLLRKDILRLNPSRFEIGPVYTANPRDRKTLRKSTAFRPLAKELVFDIDLTDYDEIRTCCSKANICHKCWSFITMAIKVVDAALRQDFGFEHIMWVYSGRRGAHAWVSDKRARDMDDPKRRAIAGYLEVIKGGTQAGKKVNLRRPLHPHIARSLDILKVHFPTDILENQDPWVEPEKAERLLALLPDQRLNEALRKKWDAAPGRSSANKWADIDALAKSGVSKTLDTTALRDAKQDIVLEYTYPRLDVEVSKKQIHLLKSPFVVHPGTGRVCVPIDPKRLQKFDPLGVPTVTELLSEIDDWDDSRVKDEEGKSKKLQDYEKTSLKQYVEFFRAHVSNLLRDERGVKREREEVDGKSFLIMFSLRRLAVRAFSIPLTPISARPRSITTLISSASRLNRPSFILPSLQRGFASEHEQYGEDSFDDGEISSADHSSSPSASEFRDQSSYVGSTRDPVPCTTLYVGNIFFDTELADVQRHFEKAGAIKEVKIIKDQRGLSKGFGYVEFEDQEAATKAVEMFHNQQLDGRRLTVQYTNRTGGSSTREDFENAVPKNPPSRTLFIGNLSFDVTDRDLNNLFAKWPKCTDVRVAIDRRTGRSRGFAHVDFVDVDSAMTAMGDLKGMEFYGRKFRLDYSEHASGYRPREGKPFRRSDHANSGRNSDPDSE